MFRYGSLRRCDEGSHGAFGFDVRVTFCATRYEGSWENGQRSGEGKCKYANGDIYVGEWVADARQGKGTCAYENGDKYTGEPGMVTMVAACSASKSSNCPLNVSSIMKSGTFRNAMKVLDLPSPLVLETCQRKNNEI